MTTRESLKRVGKHFPELFYLFTAISLAAYMLAVFDDPTWGFSQYSYGVLFTVVFPLIWVLVYCLCGRVARYRRLADGDSRAGDTLKSQKATSPPSSTTSSNTPPTSTPSPHGGETQ